MSSLRQAGAKVEYLEKRIILRLKLSGTGLSVGLKLMVLYQANS